ncbi:hypothetical protein V7S43_007287 [Phytophthora oleae]|uniref:Uncharacterized protein n=1 Tax=Phytophthora oleae TaxID=2107226 RepID=A0ABD3FQ39_9STRA
MATSVTRDKAIAAENAAFDLYLAALDALYRIRETSAASSAIVQNAVTMVDIRSRELELAARVADEADESAVIEEVGRGNHLTGPGSRPNREHVAAISGNDRRPV